MTPKRPPKDSQRILQRGNWIYMQAVRAVSCSDLTPNMPKSFPKDPPNQESNLHAKQRARAVGCPEYELNRPRLESLPIGPKDSKTKPPKQGIESTCQTAQTFGFPDSPTIDSPQIPKGLKSWKLNSHASRAGVWLPGST